LAGSNATRATSGAMTPDLLPEAGFSVPGGSMTRSKSRTRRWTSPVEVLDYSSAAAVTDSRSTPDPRAGEPRQPHGVGPYEACYDVVLGYGMERSIIVP
jgi:hypothetical protein